MAISCSRSTGLSIRFHSLQHTARTSSFCLTSHNVCKGVTLIFSPSRIYIRDPELCPCPGNRFTNAFPCFRCYGNSLHILSQTFLLKRLSWLIRNDLVYLALRIVERSCTENKRAIVNPQLRWSYPNRALRMIFYPTLLPRYSFSHRTRCYPGVTCAKICVHGCLHSRTAQDRAPSAYRG